MGLIRLCRFPISQKHDDAIKKVQKQLQSLALETRNKVILVSILRLKFSVFGRYFLQSHGYRSLCIIRLRVRIGDSNGDIHMHFYRY